MDQIEDQPVNVLLVEDDPAVLEMYRLKLEIDGYNVHIATDGEQGIAQAKALVPDIVFLDIRLPKKDGFEVLAAIRADDITKEIPVIILSNYGEQDLIERGFKLGSNEFLIKAQTTPSKLSERIKKDWLRE